MPNFASATVMGHLGGDPELKYTDKGTALCTGSIAVKTGYGDYAQTTWWRYECWGKAAENMAAWCQKGDAVHIIGTPVVDEWEKDGVKNKMAKLKNAQFVRITRSDADNTNPNVTESTPSNSSDIPF